jgi:ribonucleotide reductase alpha subunit
MSSPKSEDEMYVTKRNGEREIVSFDKILNRIKNLGQEANVKINYTNLVMKVIDQLFDGISTTKIDELSAEQCASMSSIHPDYNILAGRITVSNHHKNTSDSFVDVMTQLYEYKDKHDKQAPLVSDELIQFVREYGVELEAMVQYDRDYLIDFFGFKTLERAYLMRINKVTVERPQHMWLRVSVGIHVGSPFESSEILDRIQETYELMSQKYFTHATPTLFNAGTPRPQLSSCFLLAMENDSIEGIYNTLRDCAMISKWAGGIGLHVHNIRASGSHIRGTNGSSNGLVPMLRVYNNTAKYVDQGGGKRNGSFAIYLEPWHADIEFFLQMRKNHGDEELKARDLFYALWVPDLFMERVKTDGTWTLMCPDECPGLADVYGDAFVELYTKYEASGKGRKTVKARELWFQVLDAQMETGTPYLLYKDACNKKSNQKNLGTIKSSNLCVAPETLILTQEGHKEIQSLVGQKANVWNGTEFSEVDIVQTGTDQELVTVETDDECLLECTPYHKFFIQFGDSVKTVEAKDLKAGDKIKKCEYPIIDGADSIEAPYYRTDVIPSGTNPIRDKMEWLSGICDISGLYDNSTFYLNGLSKARATSIKLFMQTCGVNPRIVAENETAYQLLITSSSLTKLVGLGFSPRNFTFNNNSAEEDVCNEFVLIRSVKNTGRKDATFCFTEPKAHAGIFNGILTSQCSEVVQYSDAEETAVCNLASVGLPSFVFNKEDETPVFDYDKLHAVTKVVTYNLNRIIDVNFYPTPKTERSNRRHRPIGIGIQGLADVFMMMGLPFASEEARVMNRRIFETIYHAAVERSCELAELEGAYETWEGSPASQGQLQFDLWGVSEADLLMGYDWAALKARIQKSGLRNSLLLAPMPTASTSQILGYNECIEPITSNIYNRRTLAGEFILANKYMMNDLIKLDLWNEKVKNNIIANHGSIQHIEAIPAEIRERYKTVWEIPMRALIDMAADRGVFVCQSQSLNLWLEDPNYSNLTSMHFYSWSKGLKTGIYYLRRRGRHQAQQFTIEPEVGGVSSGGIVDDDTEEEICEMCSA